VRAGNSAGNTAWSTTWMFTTLFPPTSAPLLTSPANSAVNISLSGTALQWSTVSGATFYEYELDDNSSFTSPLTDTTSGLSDNTGNLLGGTVYYWRVRAGNSAGYTSWSTVFTFSTIYPPASAPSLISPIDNTVNVSIAGTTLQWSSVSGSTFYEYQFDDNASFSSPVSDTTSSLTDNTGNLLAGTVYYWRVRAGNSAGYSAWSVAFTFSTVYPPSSAPSLVSPVDNAVNISLSGTALQWNAVANSTFYEYELDDNISFSSPLTDTTSALTKNTGNLLQGTVYYWRVRAGNSVGYSAWSTVWSFSSVYAIANAPILTSPTDNAVNIALAGVSLEWLAVSSATSYEYQYDTDSMFSNPVADTTTALTETTAALLVNTTYYWRVKAINSSGNSPWSTVWSFTTVYPLTVAPMLVSPVDLATNVSVVGTTLQWQSVTGANSYEFQYATDSLFSSPFIDSTAALTFATAALDTNTTYYWKVRAKNNSGNSPWSDVWEFTTANPLTTAPSLVIPLNNATNIPFTGTFIQWSIVNGATQYEYEIDIDSTFFLPFVDSTAAFTVSTGILFPLTKYYWHVRAKNASGVSPWSEIWSFTTVFDIGIVELPANNNLEVFPNPAHDFITVHSAMSLAGSTYLIVDETGKQVLMGQFTGETTTINISSLTPGIYFLQAEKQKSRIRMIKQ
jgi:fibronectin type 3 domain-containing protein